MTFEYNPNDDLIVKLNQFRKHDQDSASMVIRQIFDNCCMESGIESVGKNMIRRVNQMMNQLVDSGISKSQIEDGSSAEGKE